MNRLVFADATCNGPRRFANFCIFVLLQFIFCAFFFFCGCLVSCHISHVHLDGGVGGGMGWGGWWGWWGELITCNVLSPLLLAGALNFVKLLFYTLLMLRLNSFVL